MAIHLHLPKKRCPLLHCPSSNEAKCLRGSYRRCYRSPRPRHRRRHDLRCSYPKSATRAVPVRLCSSGLLPPISGSSSSSSRFLPLRWSGCAGSAWMRRSERSAAWRRRCQWWCRRGCRPGTRWIPRPTERDRRQSIGRWLLGSVVIAVAVAAAVAGSAATDAAANQRLRRPAATIPLLLMLLLPLVPPRMPLPSFLFRCRHWQRVHQWHRR